MTISGVPIREFPAVVVALGVLVVVEIGLRTTTLPRLARVLGVPLGADTDTAPVESPPGRLVLTHRDRVRLRATRRATRRWPFGDTCLRRALVSGRLLRPRRPTLHLGVALVDGDVAAHAWLVMDGHSLDPAGSASFVRLGPIAESEVR